MSEFDELRRLAENATEGEWKFLPDEQPEGQGAAFTIPSRDPASEGREVWWNMLFTSHSKADAAYIAAANPATILRLLDLLQENSDDQ